MTLDEKRQSRNKRCEKFLQSKGDKLFWKYYRHGHNYTQMTAQQVHELAEDTGVEFNDLVSNYGFGASTITYEIMDHYYAEVGNGSSVGAVAMAS